MGWLRRRNTGRIYHVTDSGYGDGVRFREARERYGPFRLAILPIGAYEPRWFMRDQHMNPEEAVMAFGDCGAEFALAHHHGTFQAHRRSHRCARDRAVPGAGGRRDRPGQVPRAAARTALGDHGPLRIT